MNTTTTTNSTTSTSYSVNEKNRIIVKTVMTASEFKTETYKAYLSYVQFMDGKIGIKACGNALAPLFAKFGFTLTPNNITTVLTVRMASYGKAKGETARKIKSISTFRDFIRGGYAEVMAAPLHFNAGKAPAPAKAKKTASKKTSDKERIAALEAEIRALKAQNA